jgi:hypothetical protein
MRLYDGKLSRIFVGRKDDLGILQKTLDEIKEVNEAKKVYTILNVPGIGKTELIKYFGNELQKKKTFKYNNTNPIVEAALFFHITITDKHTLPQLFEKMVSAICTSFHKMFINSLDEIPNPYRRAVKAFDKEQTANIFIQTLDEYSTLKEIIENPTNFLQKITGYIPIILHFDEFQRSIPDNRNAIRPADQLYYQLSSFFSGILDQPIFIILSGTKYTIISTIGDNLGSPLNGKVDPIVIPFLEEKDIDVFADLIILDARSKAEIMIKIMYTKWLKYMSNGHPRTMEYMTKEFIIYFNKLIPLGFEGWVDDDLEVPFNELNELVENSLKASHLRTASINKLYDLVVNAPPTIIHFLFEYINERLLKGSTLGQLESNILAEFSKESREEKDLKKKQLRDILSKFVEVGFFSRNGQDNFYVSSIYALKYFSEEYRKWIPILSNAFEKLLSGDGLFSFIQHNAAVMGSFWEEIFSTLLSNSQVQNQLSIPRDIVDIYGNLSVPIIDKNIEIELIKERPIINTPYLKLLETEKLYMFPLAKGVDALIIYKNTVFLIQIKRSKDSAYVEKGLKEILDAVKRVKSSEFSIVPWLVDVLGGLKLEKLENKNILYTTKKHLTHLLPKQFN